MFSNLRTHLVLIALCTLAPAAVLAVFEHTAHREQRMEGLRQETLWAARAVAERQESVIEVSRRLLETLALLPEVNQASRPACDALLGDVVNVQGIYHTVAVVDRRGEFVCSALPFLPGQVNVAGRPYFQRALASRAFEIGDNAISQTTGKRAIHFAWPIADVDGSVRLLLVAAYDLTSVGGPPPGAKLPEGAVLRVTDREGVVLYRHPPREGELGRPVERQEWAEVLAKGPEAVGRIDSAEPGGRLFAARRIDASERGADMYILIDVPLAGFTAAMNRSLTIHLSALGAICLAALLFARHVGKRLVLDRVEHLRRVADRLAAGETAARADIPRHSGEFGRLAASINAMAEAIAAREGRLRLAMEELSRAEGNYRSLFENATEGIYQASLDGRFLAANPALARMLGYDTPKALLREVTDLAGQVYADPAERNRFLTELSARGSVSGFLTRLRRRDGGMLWCLFNARLTHAGDGQAGQVEATVTDVTENKLAEERLAQSERNLWAIVDNALEAILVVREGAFVFVNPRLERMLGLSRETLLARPFADFIHPDDREMVYERYLARMSDQPFTRAYDFRILTGAGGLLWVMFSAARLDWNGQPALLVMLSDITERKRTEKALREAEARYREIFENSPVAIFRATPGGRFLVVNPTYAAIAGYDSPRHMIAEVLDIATQMYVNPAERETYKALLDEHGAVRDFEARLRRRDGGEFWASMTTRVVRDENGAIISYDGFLADVTERKRAEEALRQARDDLELQVAARTVALRAANERLVDLDHQRTTFLSSASHELRTPLTSVLGFAKLARRTFSRYFLPLSDKDPLTAKARVIVENLAIIEQEGERLTRLVNDLLDLNKIEAGRMEWRDAPLEVAGELAAAARAMRGALDAKPGVRFSLDAAADAGRVMADPDRLRQLIINLLSNAVKYTDAGFIRLAARGLPGGGLEMRVEDSGPGVAEADRDRIFQKFYQVASRDPDDGKPKGTGLGLAICKNIVEHYGGDIRVEPMPGRGSAFIVVLPAAVRA